jgi:two-component system, NtrC family, sensor kinase
MNDSQINAPNDRRNAVEAEIPFQQFVETSDEITILWDLEGTVRYLSPAFHRVTARPTADWVGRSLQSLIHPDDLELYLTVHQQVNQAQAGTIDAELRLKHQTGIWKWVTMKLRPYQESQTAVTRIQGVMRDISEQRQIEMASQQSRQILQQILDALPICIFWKDRDSVYLGINQASMGAFGKSNVADVVGCTDYDLPWTTEEADWYRFCDRRVMDSGQAELNIVETQRRADGTEVFLNTNKVPLRDLEGNVIGICGTIEDISDRQAVAASLQQYADQQKVLNQTLEATLRQLKCTQAQVVQNEKMSSLGQLVAGIAHEINNPVNFIHANLTPAESYTQELLNLIELYQAEYPQPSRAIIDKVNAIDLDFIREDLAKIVASMQGGTSRIRDIVLSLRAFARLDEAQFKRVDLHEGLDSSLMLVQNRLRANPQRPEIQLVKQYSDLPEVECFAGQINQVFMNILLNAISAIDGQYQAGLTPTQPLPNEPPTIWITTTQTNPEEVAIHIKNNGPWIPEPMQKSIFDPFFTTGPIGSGTGMGLSIGYQIVTEEHGGRLLCDSRPGGHTTFSLHLPVCRGATQG